MEAYNTSLSDGSLPVEIRQAIAGLKFSDSNSAKGLALMGIFCTAGEFSVREIIRRTSKMLAPGTISVKFVICQRISAEMGRQFWAEVQLHDDIILLDCEENMNDGKTCEYFKTAPRYFPNYLYYGKSDTDTYVLYHNLAFALDTAPRCRLYMGRSNFDAELDCFTAYMSGALYVVSKDLTISTEEYSQKCLEISKNAPEDVAMGIFVHGLVEDRLQIADAGPNHSSRKPSLEELHRHSLWIHYAKTEADWWNVHKHIVGMLTVEDICESKNVTYFDGSNTKMGGLDCVSESKESTA